MSLEPRGAVVTPFTTATDVLDVDVPAGTVAGDVVVVQIAATDTAARAMLETPAGAVPILEPRWYTASTVVAAYLVPMTAPVPASLRFRYEVAVAANGIAQTWAGVDVDDPLAGPVAVVTGGAATKVVPATTTRIAGAVPVGGAAHQSASSARIDVPATWTESGNSSGLGAGRGACLGYGPALPAPGAVPSVTFTQSQALGGVGWQVALAPVADVPDVATSTHLEASDTLVAEGDPVDLTATVDPYAATGTVRFEADAGAGWQTLARVPLAAGTAVHRWTAGPDSITARAVLEPGPGFLASTSPSVAVTVEGGAPPPIEEPPAGGSSYLTPGGSWTSDLDLDRWGRFWGWWGTDTLASVDVPARQGVTRWQTGEGDVVWQAPAVDVTPGDLVEVEVTVTGTAGTAVVIEVLGSADGVPDYFVPGTFTFGLSDRAQVPAGGAGTARVAAVVPPGVSRARVGLRGVRGPQAGAVLRFGPVTSSLNGNPDGPGTAPHVRLTVNGADRTGTAWAPVEVVWGRQHPGESLDPRRLVITLDGASAVSRGDLVDLEVTAPDSDPTWQSLDPGLVWSAWPGTWLTQRVRMRVFAGRVTDTDTGWLPLDVDGPWRVDVDVVAVDPLGSLAGLVVGDEPWPLETAEERAARIARLTPLDWSLDPAGARVAARDVDARPALELLDDVASWVSVSGGVWFDPVDGLAYWLTDASRASRDPDVVLSAAQFLEEARAVESPSDLVNEFTTRYRSTADPAAAPEVTVRNASSALEDGRREASRTTDLVDVDDAEWLAQTTVTRFGVVVPRWVDVVVPFDLVDAPTREKLLGLGPRARVRLTGLPAPAAPTWPGYVEGWRLVVDDPDPTRWTVALTLSPAAWSGPLLTFDLVAPAGTFDAAVGPWAEATEFLEFTP